MKYSKISYRRARWRTRLHRGSPDQSPQWREFPESATTFHLKTTCDAQKRFRRPLGAGARTRTAQRRAGRATDRAPRGRRRAGARFNTRATARGRGRSPDSGSGGHWARREPRVVQRPAFCTKVAGSALAWPWALAWRTFLLCHSLPSSLPPRGEKSHMHMMTRPSAARATATEARITRTTRPSRRKSSRKQANATREF